MNCRSCSSRPPSSSCRLRRCAWCERADFAKYQPDVARTFSNADQVLAVLQYWLSEIMVVADVYDPARFAADPVYARHIGQLNVLTHLIQHRDSNAGNFLSARPPPAHGSSRSTTASRSRR